MSTSTNYTNDDASIRDSKEPNIVCTVCKHCKPNAEFPESVVRHQERAHRRCKACHCCPVCLRTMETVRFEPDASKCKDCSTKEILWLCEVCGIRKLTGEYAAQILVNWKKDNRQHRCQQCHRCKTCQQELATISLDKKASVCKPCLRVEDQQHILYLCEVCGNEKPSVE